jgi:two-component system, cell cycle sensor histidine kinase PleC
LSSREQRTCCAAAKIGKRGGWPNKSPLKSIVTGGREPFINHAVLGFLHHIFRGKTSKQFNMKPVRSGIADKNIVDRTKRNRNPDVARTIRRTRDRLNEGGTADFTAELLRVHAHTMVSLAPAIPLIILTLTGIAMLAGFGTQAIFWAAVSCGVYGMLGYMAQKLESTAAADVDVAKWSNRMLIAHVGAGLCWAWFAALDCRNCGQTESSVLQAVVLLLAMASTAIVTATLRRALMLSFSLPVAAYTAFTANLRDTSQVAMVVTLLAGIVFFSFIGNFLNQSARQSLEHQSEKDALIAELETAKSMSDEARSRAEEANLAKSRFLASMSHELRTPLNAILGFSEVMANEVLGPMENRTYKEYAQDINDSGQHLLNLINEILDLSRVEAGRHSLAEEVIRLSDIAEDAIHLVALKARAKEIKVISNFEVSLPQIWVDERSVRQIMLNLLSNAVKFTPAGGEISVHVGWTNGGGQYVSVKDNGPGIAEDEIPVVLSAFGQGSIAIKHAEQGTGLGLPIVQALMHLHGGKFDLRSKLRHGTEAIAIFPRDRVLKARQKMEEAGTAPVESVKKFG